MRALTLHLMNCISTKHVLMRNVQIPVSIDEITRNTHAHLCIAPVCRLCARSRCAYAVAGEARVARIRFVVGQEDVVWC